MYKIKDLGLENQFYYDNEVVWEDSSRAKCIMEKCIRKTQAIRKSFATDGQISASKSIQWRLIRACYTSFKNILSYKYFVAYMASSWRIFLNIIYSKNVKKKSRFERINLLLQFLKQCRTIQWPIFQPCKSERHFTSINSCNIYM